MIFVVWFKPIETESLSKFGDFFFVSTKTIFTFCHSSEVNCRFRAVSGKVSVSVSVCVSISVAVSLSLNQGIFHSFFVILLHR
jgi:hypothetical protein